jgi:hypothetical protein
MYLLEARVDLQVMVCIVDIAIMYGDYVRHVILFPPTREGVVKSG